MRRDFLESKNKTAPQTLCDDAMNALKWEYSFCTTFEMIRESGKVIKKNKKRYDAILILNLASELTRENLIHGRSSLPRRQKDEHLSENKLQSAAST